MLRMDKAIEDGFKRNPDLIHRPIRQIAEYFYLDGQLSYSLLLRAADAKAQFYRAQLTKEEQDKADLEWEKASKAK